MIPTEIRQRPRQTRTPGRGRGQTASAETQRGFLLCKEREERERTETLGIIFVVVDRYTRYIQEISWNAPRIFSFSLKHSGSGSKVLSVCDYCLGEAAHLTMWLLDKTWQESHHRTAVTWNSPGGMQHPEQGVSTGEEDEEDPGDTRPCRSQSTNPTGAALLRSCSEGKGWSGR